MFDWQGFGVMTAIGAGRAILGYFMCLCWWIVTGNTVEPGVTKPFLVKMWVGKARGFSDASAPISHLSIGEFDGGDKL